MDLIKAKYWVIPENIHTTPTEEILSETIFSPLPLQTAEIPSVGEYGSFLERPIIK